MIDAKAREGILRAAGQASLGHVVQLRAKGGAELAAADRDALLARAVAREAVELEVELLAFEQFPAAAARPNRKGVRVRDGAMGAVARSGRGRPFLRDHRWDDVSAIGGRITESASHKLDDGHYQIRQTVLLTEPSAVERALRGLLQAVSIGLVPTGPVLCSACGTEVMTECWHFPLDEFEADGESVLVEWIYESADLVETSEVPIPAVPTARVEAIRAALSALNGGTVPLRKEITMSIKLALAGLLGVAATAGDEEFVSAVQKLRAQVDTLAATNAELVRSQARLAAEQAAAAEQLAARECDEFIAGGIASGKVLAGSPVESSLRHYYGVDKDGAKALLAGMPAIGRLGSSPLQSGQKPAPEPANNAAGDDAIAQLGISPARVRTILGHLGHGNPQASINKYAAAALGVGQKEG